MTTFAQDAAGRREAARLLLATPVLTAARQPEQFALVRRHAAALKSMFATQLDYQLVVDSGFARLVKVPLDEWAPSRPVTRGDTTFGAQGYAVLALLCAALLAPTVGEQLLISALVDQVRSDAAENGIEIGDAISDRRRVVAALALLTSWGVVSETDGSVSAWAEHRQDEALLTIDRPLLAHLLPSPLHTFSDAADLWQQQHDVDQPRRRLRRRLVENPVVFRHELSPDELDALSRERSELTRQLEENFGLTLEVRAEGALAYDASGALTDIDFPGTGSLKQAALLLLDELVAESSSEPAPRPLVMQILTKLTTENRRTWRAAYVDSVEQLRADVVALLTALRLATETPDGLVVHPPAARYRPTVRRVRSEQTVLFEETP